jgi:hypothetical protein
MKQTIHLHLVLMLMMHGVLPTHPRHTHNMMLRHRDNFNICLLSICSGQTIYEHSESWIMKSNTGCKYKDHTIQHQIIFLHYYTSNEMLRPDTFHATGISCLMREI